MSNNKKIVFASIMEAILATAIMALNTSIMIGNAQVQKYDNQYGYDNGYNSYYQDPKSSHVDIQKISCVNSYINVNGIDST